MCKKFSEWYSQQVTELYVNGDDEPVDLSSARMKCLGAQWMTEVVEHLTMMILVLNPALIQVMTITCLKVRSQVMKITCLKTRNQVQILIALKEEKLGRKHVY